MPGPIKAAYFFNARSNVWRPEGFLGCSNTIVGKLVGGNKQHCQSLRSRDVKYV